MFLLAMGNDVCSMKLYKVYLETHKTRNTQKPINHKDEEEMREPKNKLATATVLALVIGKEMEEL